MNLDQDRVPARFDDALILLDAALTQREKDAWHSMTAAQMFELQATIARTVRTDWSLLDPQSPLRIFFRELGLEDPEEVSMLLIDAYWRMHNQEQIPVEELVREYLEE
jgi:phosphoketolase